MCHKHSWAKRREAPGQITAQHSLLFFFFSSHPCHVNRCPVAWSDPLCGSGIHTPRVPKPPPPSFYFLCYPSLLPPSWHSIVLSFNLPLFWHVSDTFFSTRLFSLFYPTRCTVLHSDTCLFLTQPPAYQSVPLTLQAWPLPVAFIDPHGLQYMKFDNFELISSAFSSKQN